MLLKSLYQAGAWKGLSTFTSNIAISLVFYFTTILVYNQRKGFPIELINADCIDSQISSSVEICMANATFLSEECQAICDRVSRCWYQSGNGQCLVGGDVLIVLCGVMNSFLGLGPAFNAIQAIKKTCASATSFLKVIEHEDTMQSGSITPGSSKGDVVYKDVDFKYASRDTQVLKQLNFTIHENEMIGIVGESGSGKSTILKLLMRLYAPTAGTITWDGVDVTTLSTAWIRDQISYVAQEPVLFSGTIRENLRNWWRPMRSFDRSRKDTTPMWANWEARCQEGRNNALQSRVH